MGLLKRVVSSIRHPVAQVTITNLASVALGTVSGILTARGLGPDGRGEWALIMALFTVALVVGELGQSGAVTYFVSRFPADAFVAIRRARRVMLIGGVLVATTGLIISPMLAGQDRDVHAACVLMSLAIISNSLFASMLFALQAQSIRMWNLGRVVQPVFYAVGIGVMFTAGELSVLGVAGALVVSTSLQFVIVSLMSRRAYRVSYEESSRSSENPIPPSLEGLGTDRMPGIERINTQWVYGLRYAAAAIPTVLAAQYDKVLLASYESPREVGIYAVATTVALLVAPFAAAVTNVVFPRASKGDLSGAARTSFEVKTLKYALIVSALVSMGLCLVAPSAVPLFFGEIYKPAVPLIWALALVMVARSLSQVVGALVRARGRPGSAAVAQVSGLVAGLVVMIPTVSTFGSMGAVVGLGVGEAITVAISFVTLRRLRHREFMEGS